MPEETPHEFGFGAQPSPHDYRTLKHDQVGAPQEKARGGTRYPAEKILNQRKVGICTAISLVQNAYVALGRRYSEDFQYLLQKVYFDRNWDEGSSPFASCHIAKTYGLLPVEHLAPILDADPSISYPAYVEKLKAIANDSEKMKDLLSKCEKVVQAYSQVNVTDDTLFAQGINDSKAGLLVRFTLGNEWWTGKDGRVSWNKLDIEPLRPPSIVVSGHQVTVSDYDYSDAFGHVARLANTWSPQWCDNGSARFLLGRYRPTEAWMLYYDYSPKFVSLPDAKTWSHVFSKTLKIGNTGEEVKALQVKLMLEQCMGRITVEEYGIFGPKTRAGVFAYQLKKGIPLSYYEKYVLRGNTVGPKTIAYLNR